MGKLLAVVLETGKAVAATMVAIDLIKGRKLRLCAGKNECSVSNANY